MIGRAEWFRRRKYGGWGVTPQTKEGWVYIAVWIGLITAVNLIHRYAGYALIAVMLLDVLHIMTQLKKDEFEVKAEAIAERNGAWAMIAVILLGIFFQVYQSISKSIQAVDPVLVATLFAGAIVKSITNWWVERKGV